MRVNKGSLLATAMLTMFGLTTVSAHAELVFVDDFDDGFLDPAWSVSFLGALGWTGGESGTRLSATHVNVTDNNTTGYVRFSRDVGALSDFSISYNFGREGDQIAWMGENTITLYDSSGNVIVRAGTADAWVAESAVRQIHVNTDSGSIFCATPRARNLRPTEFHATISRVAGTIDVSGLALGCAVPGLNNAPVARIEFRFGAFKGPTGVQWGFSEYAELVSVDGIAAVPVSTIVWVISSGLMGLIGVAKLRKHRRIGSG